VIPRLIDQFSVAASIPVDPYVSPVSGEVVALSEVARVEEASPEIR